MKRVVTLLTVALMLITGHTLPSYCQSEAIHHDRSQAAREAVSILQGIGTQKYLDSAIIEHVAAGLVSIRDNYPEVKGIWQNRDLSELELELHDSAARSVWQAAGSATGSTFTRVELTNTGIRALDKLNEQHGARRVMASCFSFINLCLLSVEFTRPVNIPVVAEPYKSLPHVRNAGHIRYFGDGSWIKLIPKQDVYHFVFARGGGDCPAGCTEWDYYYFTYDPGSGKATKNYQLLNVRSHDYPIHLWNVPTRRSIMPYANYEQVKRGAEAPEWWVRQHALDVLIYLLGTETTPWLGAGEQDRFLFTRLDKAVENDRRGALNILVDHLTDTDPDLRLLCLDGLRAVTKQHLGGDLKGQHQWREWLKTHP